MPELRKLHASMRKETATPVWCSPMREQKACSPPAASRRVRVCNEIVAPVGDRSCGPAAAWLCNTTGQFQPGRCSHSAGPLRRVSIPSSDRQPLGLLERAIVGSGRSRYRRFLRPDEVGEPARQTALDVLEREVLAQPLGGGRPVDAQKRLRGPCAVFLSVREVQGRGAIIGRAEHWREPTGSLCRALAKQRA